MPNSHSILQSSLETRARQIVKALGGHWSRKSGMCCCPAHDDRTPSLSIGVAESAILFHCFAGCTSEEVLAGLKRCGIRPSDLFDGKGGQIASIPKPFGPDVNALRLWQHAVPLAGTVGERYLANRSIPLRSSELRFLDRTPLGRKPDVRFLPALIAAVRMDIGIVAIQRTFIERATASKADFFKPKRALGQLGAGAVRLSEPVEGRLGLAEGSESALSAQILFGIPCWATLGNERFGIVVIPESITELHLFVDADKGGELALKRGIEAYARPGRTIIPHKPDRPDNDWNDELRERVDSHAAA
nr:toprim domain-containing protein [uncultured Sphingorhabdus sp.]